MAIQDIFNAVLAFDEDKVKQLTLGRGGGRGHGDRRDSQPGSDRRDGHGGREIQPGDLFVPEMLIASQAMKAALGISNRCWSAGIRPGHRGDRNGEGGLARHRQEPGGDDDGRGRLRRGGLGGGRGQRKVRQAAAEHKAHVVGLSALLTTTMPSMKTTVTAVRKAGLNSVRVVIGGAPITQQFATEIGADGYAPRTPAGAVKLVKKLMA